MPEGGEDPLGPAQLDTIPQQTLGGSSGRFRSSWGSRADFTHEQPTMGIVPAWR